MPNIESLETRRLLSRAVHVSGNEDVIGTHPIARLSTSGTLEVFGTSAADRIDVTQGSASRRIRVNIRAIGGMSNAFSPSFAAKDVKRIVVQAGNRNDTVILDGVGVPAELDGGNGNDTLITTTANATLVGGAGNDSLKSSVLGLFPAFNYPRFPSVFNRNTPFPAGVTVTDISTGTGVFVNGNGGTYQLVTASGSNSAGNTIQFYQGNASQYLFYPGNVTTLITPTHNRLDGGAGDDTFQSLGGDDSIIGGGGDDTFTPLAGGVDVSFADLPTVKSAKRDNTRPSRVAVFGVESLKGTTQTALVAINLH